ncbi:MAG: glycogen/starch synthase, partial [Sulfolobales archaeon]|nr:glycogen/starch synthase [Sulfolobales archaeon]
MPLRRLPGCLAPEDVERAWLLTFEYAGVASLGGLGNAVRRFAEGLLELGVKVTVITPSHGRHFDEGFARSVNLR